MDKNILDYTLNAPLNLKQAIIFVLVFLLLWHLVIKRFLRKCNPVSFWYELYELGPLAALGIVIFLGILVIIFIASVQAIIAFGIKMLLPMVLFWGFLFAFAYHFIRYCKKK